LLTAQLQDQKGGRRQRISEEDVELGGTGIFQDKVQGITIYLFLDFLSKKCTHRVDADQRDLRYITF
jgi:hypothetical protein